MSKISFFLVLFVGVCILSMSAPVQSTELILEEVEGGYIIENWEDTTIIDYPEPEEKVEEHREEDIEEAKVEEQVEEHVEEVKPVEEVKEEPSSKTNYVRKGVKKVIKINKSAGK